MTTRTATFTPGPWKIGVELSGGRTIISGRYIVASAHSGGGMDEQYEANARLIAAAPELYAAVRKVLAGLEMRLDAAPPNAIPVFTGIADLHDAINKADGWS